MFTLSHRATKIQHTRSVKCCLQMLNVDEPIVVACPDSYFSTCTIGGVGVGVRKWVRSLVHKRRSATHPVRGRYAFSYWFLATAGGFPAEHRGLWLNRYQAVINDVTRSILNRMECFLVPLFISWFSTTFECKWNCKNICIFYDLLLL